MGFVNSVKAKGQTKDSALKEKYIKGLSKSKKGFFDKLKDIFSRHPKIDEDYFEELEEALIESDVGVRFVDEILEATREQIKEDKVYDEETVIDILVSKMFEAYTNSGSNCDNDIHFVNDGPTVLLMVGVNGVGKTTTIAKLAKRYQAMGKKIMFGAADTFRAGAVEQLKVWAERLGIDIVYGQENADPASVAYDAAYRAKRENVDLLIIDTAGRLQNKTNLMDELGKIKRVIGKEINDGPHEIFLVIDATTGQNGVIQAKAFADVTGLTGVVITKMDGTSKGGIILSIRNEIGVPVRFIGLGESFDDLAEFDLEQYLYGLCVGNE